MESIQLDELAHVSGGRATGAQRPVAKPSIFGTKKVVNGPVTLDNSFELLLKKQGGNSVQELRIPRR
jgi:hypothetical protein